MQAVRLSVVVPTNERWGQVAEVVDAMLPEAHELGAQIVVCGAGRAAPPPFAEGVTVVHDTGGDLFTARAKGLAAVTGDVVAMLEDHTAIPPGWLTDLAHAWTNNPTAEALRFDVTCAPDAGLLEQALFTITFGPFMGTTEAPRDRSPIPGMVSLRRSLLPAQPAVGEFEYDVLSGLAARGTTVAVHLPAPVHAQHVRWRALSLNFHSGRAYGSACAARDGRRPLRQAARAARELRSVVRHTLAAHRRVRGGVSVGFAACAAALVGAHAVGQAVGALSGSPGRSHARLD